jgi:hypothetical protein
MHAVMSHLEEAQVLIEHLPTVEHHMYIDRYREAEERLRREITELRWLAKGLFDGTIEEDWNEVKNGQP